jgi:hypothetical protein
MAMNRKHAEREYSKALSAVRAAEDISEKAYEAAKQALAIARTNLIAAEAAQPTATEINRAARTMMLRNRGMDV